MLRAGEYSRNWPAMNTGCHRQRHHTCGLKTDNAWYTWKIQWCHMNLWSVHTWPLTDAFHSTNMKRILWMFDNLQSNTVSQEKTHRALYPHTKMNTHASSSECVLKIPSNLNTSLQVVYAKLTITANGIELKCKKLLWSIYTCACKSERTWKTANLAAW